LHFLFCLQGRNPYYLDPALVLLITDGCSPMDPKGILKDVSVKKN